MMIYFDDDLLMIYFSLGHGQGYPGAAYAGPERVPHQAGSEPLRDPHALHGGAELGHPGEA